MGSRKFSLCGLCNPLVDLMVNVSEEQFESFHFERGTMRLVDDVEQRLLLGSLNGLEPIRVSGGSVANSVIAFSQLGGRAAILGCVGDDAFGHFYRDECESLGVGFPVSLLPIRHTGVCLALITPDAERTMRTSLGAATHISAEMLPDGVIEDSEWLFLEGYVLANPDFGAGAVRSALERAKKANTKVAFTLSEPWVVDSFRNTINDMLPLVDLLFANEHELCKLLGTQSDEAAIQRAKGSIADFVMTRGAKGAYVRVGEEEGFVSAFQVDPIDLLGSGDMFAGSFLYGYLNGLSPLEAAKRGCFMASKVICQVGARLRGDIQELWRAY